MQNANLAAVLYILDHLFFALAIAIKTYFQKIADHADIASSAGVSFTISHIAAVILPVVLGVVWLTSPSAVFLTGSCFAALSLVFCFSGAETTPIQEMKYGCHFAVEAAR